MQYVDDRRKHSRLALNRLVIVKDEAGSTKKLIGVNYSTHGIALTCSIPLDFGEYVDLQFWLTEPETKEINMTAKVIQNSKEGDIYLTSLKFVGEILLN